jgi:hypothetical protein
MSDDQPQTAETLFGQTRREIRDVIKIEEKGRAALVKKLYRLRAPPGHYQL